MLRGDLRLVSSDWWAPMIKPFDFELLVFSIDSSQFSHFGLLTLVLRFQCSEFGKLFTESSGVQSEFQLAALIAGCPKRKAKKVLITFYWWKRNPSEEQGAVALELRLPEFTWREQFEIVRDRWGYGEGKWETKWKKRNVKKAVEKSRKKKW